MEPIGTGAAANVSSEAAKGIFHEIKRHIRYVIIYKENVEKFEEKLRMLIAKRETVQQDVGVAERNGEKIKADVQLWRNRVDKVITEEEKKVKDLEDKAKNKCFFGLCPNIKSRHQLSRKAEEDAAAFDDLISKCQFNGVGYRDVPKAIVQKDFETFKSREKVFNDIMESLKDATMSMIGVYGMPGVGKTSLVKEVVRQVQDVKLFDSVVTAIVSRMPDIQKIQDQISESLGLNLKKEKTPVVRARRLCERLKNEKKLLIILDDIWEKLDLEEVGIPFGSQHEECKILLTSRNQNVLCNQMDATKTFAIGDLDELEAWEFFKKMAGDSVESADLRPTAIKVAKKCAKLPLAIATVARALRNKNLFAWKDALRQLQRPSSENSADISADVFSAIKLSYDHLQSKELKQTFLLCSLLPRNSGIEDLLRYAIGLGFINGVKTLAEARDRLLTMVSNLKASCLLLDSNTNEQYFDVHDLTYIVAKSIASKDNHVFTLKEDDGRTDWPDEETMKKCNKICLQYPIISKLPDELNCPQLFLFFMFCKDLSLTLPDNFFKGATNLKVLDLTRMHFSSLPSSIRLLTSLCTLCLDQCKFGDIAIIGGLTNLEILSLLKSDIKILPKEIGQLVQLKLFDLSHCTKLKTISPGVLSSLSRLEELYMGGTFIQWEVERPANERSNASLAELKNLSRLSTLEVHIPDAMAAPRDLFFKVLLKLERFKIFIGKEWKRSGNYYKYARTLKLGLSTSIDDLDWGIKIMLKKTEDLYLDELEGVKIALQELTDGESLPELKKLHIQNGSDIEYIINDNDAADKNGFLKLKSLTLEDLPQLVSFCPEHNTGATSMPQQELPLFQRKMLFPSLENLQLSSINVSRIWHNQLSNASFFTHEKLTTLIIQDCGNLKHLLSFSVARSLVHLKYFKITGCKCLREIIFTEDIEEETQVMTLFPQLIYLELRDLQHLIGFCSNSQTEVIEFSSMKSLKIDSCPNLEGFIYESTMEGNQQLSRQALFDNKVAFPSLVKMSISYLRNMKMLWQNPLPANSFPKLQHMGVEGCDQLSTIFPSNMLTTFQGLQTLNVRSCVSLKEVFEVESLNMEEKETTVITTQLRQLYIEELPNLKYIWKNDPQGIFSFENLRVIVVRCCWDLKNVFPASVARDLPQLSNLQIYFCGVEEIVSKEEGSETVVAFEFEQLSLLWLWYLPELKCFYPGEHTTKWPVLTKLKSCWCPKMKIFGTKRCRPSIPEITKNGQLDSPIQPPLLLAEKVIPKLEELSLHSDDIAMINDCQFSSSLFHEIKVLTVYGDRDKSVNCGLSFFERFDNLEKLVVESCEFKELFCTEGDTSNQETSVATLSTIRNLNLVFLHNLKYYLWKQDVQVNHILPNLETLEVDNCDNLISLGSSSASFQYLSTLSVQSCKEMKYLDTSLAVQSLAQLKKLIVRDCISMTEIVGNEGDEATCNIIFSRLKSLELQRLPLLKSFCSRNNAFEFPSLEEVVVNQCPELEIFCKGVLNVPLLQRVEYEKDKGHWGGDLNSTVQQLYSRKVGCQGITHLALSEKTIEIWKEYIQGTLDFKKLKVLEVCECNSLKYIFSVSMALELVRLEKIKVKNCPMMERIITNEGAEEAAMDAIMSTNLKFITLESCSNLTSFYLGSNTLQCPSLLKIEVDDCPKMYTMASTIIPGEQDGIETIGGESTPFFNDKVLCPSLTFLLLTSTNIQKLWPDKPHIAISSNVRNLGYLTVKGCRNLEYLFPSFSIKNFVQLQRLSLLNCENMEKVIFTDGLEEEGITQTYLFPQLQILELVQLPRLGGFCHGDNSEIDAPALFNEKVAFPSLNHLTIEGMGNWRKIWHDEVAIGSFSELNFLSVDECERLLNIFPFNMVERLEKLETLKIWDCGSLEEIIEPDHRLNSNESHAVTATELIEAESTTKFVFPKIRMLSLCMLPKLKGFYSKMHATEWPSLKELFVVQCNNVETFAGEYLNFRETQGQSQRVISVQQPLFWVSEETFPNLEKLLLSRNGIMKEIWHGALPKQYFCNLRSLELTSLPKTSVANPNCIIQSLPNLERLSVEKAAFNEIFPCEGLGDEDEHAGTLARLKELRLSKLPKLTHLWKKELSFGEVFYNLEILEVLGCGKLKNLVPSFVSFKTLTTLEVSKCHGFKNLVTFRMAKSMVQLKRMSISDCQMIEEVIASTADEVMDGIVFSQLKSLKLDSLPSLSRFYSGKYTLVFPSLEEVIMRQCSRMEFFTKGELSTPMLQGIQSTKGEYVGLWKGDLNTIIQQLFMEKVFPSLEDLELSSINIQRIWNNKLLVTHSYAQNLTCFTIEGCHNLNCLFSSSMVKSFVHLKKLNIENCENVENVIFVEGLAKEEMTSQKLFRALEFLLLKDLPNLTRFCQGKYFEFPLLRILRIESCPTLKTFISDAEGNNSEMTSPTLFDEKVAFSCLEDLSIIGVGNWRKIWHNQSTNCARIHFANY